jgi:alkylation response protein AidB-like acyl-CoA dehydrogenase
VRGQLSDEQEAYQDALRGWLGRTADPATVRGWLDRADDMSFERRFADDGWAGVGVAEGCGGQGGGLVELAITAQELGRSSAPSGTWLASVLAAPLLGALDGALLVPAEAIPHLAATAERVPRVLGARSAKHLVVPGSEGLAVVAAEHVEVTPRSLLDRSRSVGDVRVTEARKPLDVDPSLLVEASARAAVLVAADALGASQRMLDLAVEYAGQRHQFGVPIGSFQAVKHAAATMLVGIEAARSIVYFAAASVDAPADRRDPQWLLHAAAAKAQVTAEAARAADTALTLHGAVGYTWEHDLQLSYKRAKLDEALFGTPEAWNRLIADGLSLT